MGYDLTYDFERHKGENSRKLPKLILGTGMGERKIFTWNDAIFNILSSTSIAKPACNYIRMLKLYQLSHLFIDYTVWRCRDSRLGKQGRDDGMKQFSIQPHLT